MENVVTTYGYDSFGNAYIEKIGNDDLKIQTNSTYDASVSGTDYKGGNYLKSVTDPVGNTVTYTNDWKTGNLTSFVDGNGKTTNYQYDSMDRLKTVTAAASGISNTYSYTDQSGNVTDSLQSITHNGFSYKFLYDKLGNTTGVNVGSRNLVTNVYSNFTGSSGVHNTGRLKQMQFGNGQSVSFDYDSLDRTIGKNISGTRRFTFDYDEAGNVALITDNRTNSMTRYFYNASVQRKFFGCRKIFLL